MAATRSLIAIVALALAPACGGGGSSGTVIIEGDPVDETVAEGQARGDSLAGLSYDELVGDDFLIQVGKTASILGALHDGEIIESEFAVQVVQSDDTFDFANDLIIDHEDGNAELDDVVRFYGIGFIPSDTADALASDAQANLGLLRSTHPADVDFQFVEIQVIQHAQAQVLLDQLYDIVGAGEMGDYILNTMDMIDSHLASAETLLASYY